MQEKTVPLVAELADLVGRARRACETTAQLVQDYKFLVMWHSMRPRSRLRPYPMLDEWDAD